MCVCGVCVCVCVGGGWGGGPAPRGGPEISKLGEVLRSGNNLCDQDLLALRQHVHLEVRKERQCLHESGGNARRRQCRTLWLAGSHASVTTMSSDSLYAHAAPPPPPALPRNSKSAHQLIQSTQAGWFGVPGEHAPALAALALACSTARRIGQGSSSAPPAPPKVNSSEQRNGRARAAWRCWRAQSSGSTVGGRAEKTTVPAQSVRTLLGKCYRLIE